MGGGKFSHCFSRYATSRHKDEEIWDNIVEKIGSMESSISFPRREGHFNELSFGLLPTYVMSLFPIPVRVVKKLNKLRREFLRKGNKQGGGYNLVKWEVVQLSKMHGGLGIKNLRIQNNCLLMKWLWRFNKEETPLWKEIIIHKFGQNSPWCSSEVNSTYGVGVWSGGVENYQNFLAKNAGRFQNKGRQW